MVKRLLPHARQLTIAIIVGQSQEGHPMNFQAPDISALLRFASSALNPDGQIDVVRHGEAGSKAKAAGGIDFNRHLTPTGWTQVRYLGTKIAKNEYDLGITTG